MVKKRKVAGRKIALIVSVIIVGLIVILGWNVLPMASGYGAKNLCSCVFVAQRNDSDVIRNELNFFPVNWGSYTVDHAAKTVVGQIFGLARQKAIYREGYGCTLVNELTEEQIRQQANDFPRHSPGDSVAADYWPAGDLIRPHSTEGIDSLALLSAVHNAFVETNEDELKRTRAVVIVHKGEIIAEEYAPGFSMQSRLMGWSMTKSVTSALVGIAVKKGLLDINKPVPFNLLRNAPDDRHLITTKQLLQQTSGINFREIYTRPSEVTRMLFQEGSMGGYTASLPSAFSPGTRQYYSSGNTNILMAMLREVLAGSGYHSFPYAELFDKIGMHSALIETDATGNFVGSSYMYATARDWARFGLLYLNKGYWNGMQILPTGWVDESVRPALADSPIQYGYQWWLNTANAAGKRKYETLPADLYYADGYESQFIFVIPSRDLVIVRLGLTKGEYFSEKQFIQSILRSLKY